MAAHGLHRKVNEWLRLLQHYADRPWYPPLISLLVALDNFVLVIPSDGILVSSSMLTPRRWITLAVSVTAGATVGALALAAAVELWGISAILQYYPGLNETRYWVLSVGFFEQYGLLLVFAVSLSPLPQQPPILLAAMARASYFKLGAAILAGRLIKYLLLSYLGSHAPKLLGKLWGIREELRDAGVEPEDSAPPGPKGASP